MQRTDRSFGPVGCLASSIPSRFCHFSSLDGVNFNELYNLLSKSPLIQSGWGDYVLLVSTFIPARIKNKEDYASEGKVSSLLCANHQPNENEFRPGQNHRGNWSVTIEREWMTGSSTKIILTEEEHWYSIVCFPYHTYFCHSLLCRLPYFKGVKHSEKAFA